MQVTEMTCFPSEKSLHTLREKGTAFKDNGMNLTLANAQRGGNLKQKILLTYIYHRLVNSTHNGSLKSLSDPRPRLHLEQLKQRQETTSLAT